jgi:hypothetical protein
MLPASEHPRQKGPVSRDSNVMALPCGCPKPKLRSCDLLIFVEETAVSVLAVDAVGVGLARLWEGA